VTTTEAESFYREMTTRNRGFIAADVQRKVSAARVLVAGCGSTGGAAVEPLVRLGFQYFDLAYNGCFELNNLNRQSAGHRDLGRNKAQVARERVLAVNPYAQATALPSGITGENAHALAETCDVIIDGVDVTARSGWQAKLLLHKAAVAHRKPVLTGYDMAGRQYVRFYDYRAGKTPAFDGRISDQHVETLSSWALLARAVPTRVVPWEMLREARAHLGEADYSVPQLVYTSSLYGALAARMATELLAGGRVRREIVVDIHHAVRTRLGRIESVVRWGRELVATTGDIIRLRRGGAEANNVR
jgi:molybdopterin/thiamine biosynthesis adenylyltransferase